PGPKCVASDSAGQLVPWTGTVRPRAVAYSIDAGDVLELKPDASEEPSDAGSDLRDASTARDAAKPKNDSGTAGTRSDAQSPSDAGSVSATHAFPFAATNFDPEAHDVSDAARTAVKLDCQSPTFDSTTLEFTNWCGPTPSPIVIDQAAGSD